MERALSSCGSSRRRELTRPHASSSTPPLPLDLDLVVTSPSSSSPPTRKPSPSPTDPPSPHPHRPRPAGDRPLARARRLLRAQPVRQLWRPRRAPEQLRAGLQHSERDEPGGQDRDGRRHEAVRRPSPSSSSLSPLGRAQADARLRNCAASSTSTPSSASSAQTCRSTSRSSASCRASSTSAACSRSASSSRAWRATRAMEPIYECVLLSPSSCFPSTQHERAGLTLLALSPSSRRPCARPSRRPRSRPRPSCASPSCTRCGTRRRPGSRSPASSSCSRRRASRRPRCVVLCSSLLVSFSPSAKYAQVWTRNESLTRPRLARRWSTSCSPSPAPTSAKTTCSATRTSSPRASRRSRASRCAPLPPVSSPSPRT